MRFLKNSKNEAGSKLSEMVAAARTGRESTLSGDTCSAILTRALHPEQAEAPLPALFAPTRRLIVAAGLPAILGAVLLVGLEREVAPAGEGQANGTPRIAATKVGDEVHFNVSNGGRPHYLARSASADGFADVSRVRLDGGAYVEELSDSAALVFYRID